MKMKCGKYRKRVFGLFANIQNNLEDTLHEEMKLTTNLCKKFSRNWSLL